ncbi:segregation/condensation protein A [uncultured Sphaerochaeta sp.]|uniref:segregation and condensation protein A n=1 Tax=uncultured Sphaerochaeta sp. TaxID=886478 RepID=UPI002A0A88BD|nr:segregation/condensation protein A [uncultured Sphaerochaeta sp.]
MLENITKPIPSSDSDGKNFHTNSFDGPLDLLLFLIQKSEINIYDIPISQITDQFLDYLNTAKNLELGDLTGFYKMAADLLYIKSRMLLPVDIDFDEEYEDPRQELVEQLLEYQKFRKYTELLTSAGGSGELYVSRKPTQFILPFGDEELFSNVTLQDLLRTFSRLMTTITPNKIFNVYESVTVNEKIALMNELFETREYITIMDIIIHPEQPLHIICSFMAILESCKFKMILIEQQEPFGEIVMQRRPENYDKNLADLYDEEYDEIIEHNLEDDLDQDDFSVINDDSEPIEEKEMQDDEEDEETELITADDGRVFQYDDDSEAEQIDLTDE